MKPFLSEYFNATSSFNMVKLIVRYNQPHERKKKRATVQHSNFSNYRPYSVRYSNLCNIIYRFLYSAHSMLQDNSARKCITLLKIHFQQYPSTDLDCKVFIMFCVPSGTKFLESQKSWWPLRTQYSLIFVIFDIYKITHL